MDVAIRTEGLTKHYGATQALEGLDLTVPEGEVFGFLGPNGAGKTTTIRLLLGLLRPTRGRAEVLGRDAWSERDVLHRDVGYLPAPFVAYGHLTGEQYLRFLADLRGGDAWAEAELLAKRLDLDLERRIDALSHGNRQKLGLVQAFMHRPALLVLDEPTSGLDPLVQQEFAAFVREARDAGSTVFLSSHILHEVEEIADRVAILRTGELVVVEQMERLKARALHRLELTFTSAPPRQELEAAAGVSRVDLHDGRAHVAVTGSTADLLRRAAPFGIERLVSRDEDLEEIFLTYYRQE